MIGKENTNHSTSGFGVPITSASKRIVFPSFPSVSRNFLINSGGIDEFASLTYQRKEKSDFEFLKIYQIIRFTLVNFDASDGAPFPASFSAITRNS